MIGKVEKGDQPLSLIGRRAFLKLPLEERRRKMAEQAEKMSTYYMRNTEWRETQGGDLIEYRTSISNS
jgi:hypothetical protein